MVEYVVLGMGSLGYYVQLKKKNRDGMIYYQNIEYEIKNKDKALQIAEELKEKYRVSLRLIPPVTSDILSGKDSKKTTKLIDKLRDKSFSAKSYRNKVKSKSVSNVRFENELNKLSNDIKELNELALYMKNEKKKGDDMLKRINFLISKICEAENNTSKTSKSASNLTKDELKELNAIADKMQNEKKCNDCISNCVDLLTSKINHMKKNTHNNLFDEGVIDGLTTARDILVQYYEAD